MSRASRQQGFTLIELLIAIAVFVVMAAMAYGGLSAVIDTREAVTGALDRSKTLQLAVWRIRNDLEQIVERPIRDSFGDTQPMLLGSAETGLQFTRNGWRNPLGERRSTLQRVAYRLDEDNKLVRLYWRVLDQAQDSAPVESTLLPDVERIEWRYLDRKREWQDRWPENASIGAGIGLSGNIPGSRADNNPNAARAMSEPPLAIELRLTTETWGELRLLFMVPGAEPSLEQ